MKRSFISISIDRQSYDYDALSDYLYNSIHVSRASFMENGFFIDFRYDNDCERKGFISDIMLYDILDMYICDVLYEDFICDR